jgi:hypothetical protein
MRVMNRELKNLLPRATRKKTKNQIQRFGSRVGREMLERSQVSTL